MSHFTTVKTKIKDLVCLLQALKDLDMKYTQAEEHQAVHVRGYQGQTTDAILSIHVSNSYDVGVKQGIDGTFEFVADWWGVETTRGCTEEEFLRQVTQRYSYHKVIEEIKKRGFTIETEEETEEERIEVRVRTWV